jgi:hypothetical protein
MHIPYNKRLSCVVVGKLPDICLFIRPHPLYVTTPTFILHTGRHLHLFGGLKTGW